MNFRPYAFLALLPTLGLLGGCDTDSEDLLNEEKIVEDAYDDALRDLIAQHSLTGNPASGLTVPSILGDKAQLGMELFFSKALGGDKDVACASCHHPALGGGDALSLPLGVGADNPELLGPGRTIGDSEEPNVPRNSPTTFNVALWDSVMFHDGRVESVGKTDGANGDDGNGINTPEGEPDAAAVGTLPQAQARFPVTSVPEMCGSHGTCGDNSAVRDNIVDRLRNGTDGIDIDVDNDTKNDWVELFEAVDDYPAEATETDIITFDRVTEAIAEYERTQIFVNTDWRTYVAGDKDALSMSQKRGAFLFFNPVANGGANCVACHSGDFFTDEGFHVLAMPQIGEGKGNDVDDAGPAGSTGDFGRFNVTAAADDKYAFRTPTLLNVALTAPYGHAGAYDTLEEVIRHHLDPAAAIDEYFATAVTWCNKLDQLESVTDCDALYPDAQTNTEAALTQLQSLQAAEKSLLQTVELTDSEVTDLVNFLGALTDSCVTNATCIGNWIPVDEATDKPELQLNAVDENDQPLTSN